MAIDQCCGLSTVGAYDQRTFDATKVIHSQDIAKQVDTLNGVSAALHGLADQHDAMADGLLCVAEGVRNMATMLAVLLVVKP